VKRTDGGKLEINTNTGPLGYTAECLIWAIGRDPNVDIGLDKTGIRLDKHGYNEADE